MATLNGQLIQGMLSSGLGEITGRVIVADLANNVMPYVYRGQIRGLDGTYSCEVEIESQQRLPDGQVSLMLKTSKYALTKA